ncbi:MAG: class I SAM-dependent methyltransferase [Acidimicrobiia bacterium]
MPPLRTDLDAPTDEIRDRIEAHPFWYHTIDVAPGVTTPGWFDLRHSLDLVPFPDVRGKRCLDIGTYDGFYAFEMERRGAAEVVAVDVEDHESWDWPADARTGGPFAERTPGMSGPPKGAGFRLLADVVGSAVDWRVCSIYDLDPAVLGTFDVVVCGTLLLHLQDPVRALEAVRSVCGGELLSVEQVELWLSVVHRRQPVARLRATGPTCQWWLYNAACHRQLLFSAGFDVVDQSPFFSNRLNEHPDMPWTAATAPTHLARWAITRDRSQGVLHRALLGRPRL